MLPVGVTAYDILGVHNTHALHVLFGDFGYQAIRQFRRVLVGMVHRIIQPASRLTVRLSLLHQIFNELEEHWLLVAGSGVVQEILLYEVQRLNKIPKIRYCRVIASSVLLRE